MELTINERKNLKGAVAKLGAFIEPTHFVTANFNRDVTYEGAKQALKEWHARVDRALLGRKWARTSCEDRTTFIAFVEHLASNMHWHILVKPAVTNRYIEFEDAGLSEWHKLVPSGSIDIQKLVTDEDVKKVASYCSKDLSRTENYERFVLSGEFVTKK